MLVEAYVAAGALVPAVALLWSGEAAGEMGSEASAVLYRPSQPYHPVNLESGLLRDMPTPPPSQSRPHPTHVRSYPGPRSSPGFVVVSLRCPPLAPSGGGPRPTTCYFAELCFLGASPEERAPED